MLPEGLGDVVQEDLLGRSSSNCSIGRELCMGLFCKTWTHTESQKTGLCLPASCDSSTAQRNNCQWPRPYQITTQQMEKAKNKEAYL